MSFAAPFQYRQDTSFAAYLLLVLAAAMGLIASLAGDNLARHSRNHRAVISRVGDEARLLRLTTNVGWFGVAIRYFDLIVLRNYASFNGATEFRIDSFADGDNSAGAIQVTGALLSSIAAVPLLLMIVGKGSHRYSPRRWASGGILFAAQTGYGIARGGRTSLTFYGVALVVALLLRVQTNGGMPRRGRRRTALIVLMLISTVLLTSRSFLVDRLEVQGLTTWSGFQILETQHEVEFKDGNEIRRTEADYVTVSLIHYLIHSPHEFNELMRYREQEGAPPTWGTATLSPIARVIPGVEPVRRSEAFHEPAVFTTFLGPLVVDFGIVGALIVSMVFMAWAGFLYRRSIQGLTGSRLVYTAVAPIVLHAPVLNLIESSSGFFGIVGVAMALSLSVIMATFRAAARRGSTP